MPDNPKWTYDDSMSLTKPTEDMDDKELIALMERRINENLMILQDWREWEVRENFAMFEGNQWSIQDYQTQQSNLMPALTVNRVKPVFESICGWEQQNRLEIKYNPRLMNPEQMGFNDMMGNIVAWIEQSTFADTLRSYAFKDMLICGIGATDTTINYDTGKGTGDVQYERIFPAFLFWDPSARGKNILDADWVIKLKVVNRDIIRQEYDLEYYDDVYSAQLDARILEFFSSVLAIKQLGVIYEYQWRDKVCYYRVENPFKMMKGMTGYLVNSETGQSYMLDKFMMIVANEFGFDPMVDSQFSVEKNDYSRLKATLDKFGFTLKKTEQYKYKYYRAIITGGQVITRADNYTQQGFSIKFMTDQFSEISQYYYGLMRGAKVPQRMLNQAVSDFQGFLMNIPKGGVEIEQDAVTDVQAFVDTWARAKYVSVYAPNGLQKSRPKVSPPIPQGLLEMIQYVDQQIMQVCGVTPELMGMINSKEMNAQFYQQQVRQGLTPLQSLMDAKRMMMHEQGKLYIDVARILAENDEGRLIANVTGDSKAPFFPLLKSSIAEDYDVVISDMPDGPGHNQEMFGKLLELQGELAGLPNPVNIMPLALEYSDLDEDVKEKIIQMMQPKPQPPVQPDPVNQALLQSQAMLNQANAKRTEVEAQEKIQDMKIKQSQLGYMAQQNAADIHLTQAKATGELARAHHDEQDLKVKTFSALSSHINKLNQGVKNEQRNI